jgi:hypothetical protein
LHVIQTTEAEEVPTAGEFDARKVWLALDGRGLELEIVPLVLSGELPVIHSMPTALRRQS